MGFFDSVQKIGQDIQNKFNQGTEPIYQRTTPILTRLAEAQNKVVKEFKSCAPDQSKGSDYKGTQLDYEVRFHKSRGDKVTLSDAARDELAV